MTKHQQTLDGAPINWKRRQQPIDAWRWFDLHVVGENAVAPVGNASQRIVEDRVPFKVDFYKLEGGEGWSLEVVTEDGTSIVWDDLFEDDRAAFEEAITTIRSEGAVAFANGGSNVVSFKQ